jgi:DNA polymerase elongation subunit (family B)
MFIANKMAHDTCVLIPNVLATVAPTDNLLTMIAHERKMVVPNRGSHKETRAAGGWVAKPKKGVHKFVGSTDLNSLYPSVIRAFNMSPETIIGQVDISGTWKAIDDHCKKSKKNSFANWWNDRFCPLEMEHFFNNDNYHKLIVNFENGEQIEVTGAELRKIIFESGQPWEISANGTIFRHDILGDIPGMLTDKYAERKRLQAIEKSFTRIIEEGIPVNLEDVETDTVPVSEDELYYLDFSILAEPSIDTLKKWGLSVRNGALWPNKNSLEMYKNSEIYWNKVQTVIKLLLNGCYGAILNVGCRFFDQRIGQSTTLSGRNITKHMTAKTNEMLCGIYDHYGKCVIYGDSVTGDTVINTSLGNKTIEEMFNEGDYEVVNNKEYSINHDLKVLSYDQERAEPYFGSISYVYRHEVSKQLYEVTDTNGNKVVVTEDHSVMVLHNGKLIEKKPQELTNEDTLVTISYDNR